MNLKNNLEIEKVLSEKNLNLRRAEISDIDNILELYSERTTWFKNNGIKQWSKYLEHHPKDEFLQSIQAQTYYILEKNNHIIAGFELSTDSKYWEDNVTLAFYIYKLVTKVGYKNIGNIVFEICKSMARNNGKKYLRLDCLQSNKKLNDIYENHGFKLIKNGSKDYYKYSLREYSLDNNEEL